VKADMKIPSPYDRFSTEYDLWFDKNPKLYQLELQAVKRFLPPEGRGVEIGTGTGRFAAPLGITTGVEPSEHMGRLARERGVEVVQGVAECLPFASNSFDFALFVTVICFLDDVQRSMNEVFRILKRGGEVVVAFIDSKSPLGKKYSAKKAGSRFYRQTSFLTADQLEQVLRDSGFSSFRYAETLIEDPETGDFTDLVKEGHGKGSFAVIHGKRE